MNIKQSICIVTAALALTVSSGCREKIDQYRGIVDGIEVTYFENKRGTVELQLVSQDGLTRRFFDHNKDGVVDSYCEFMPGEQPGSEWRFAQPQKFTLLQQEYNRYLSRIGR